MGSIQSGGTLARPIPTDYRIEKCLRNFELPKNKLEQLWILFAKNDIEASGYISMDDFFEKIIHVSRSKLTDALFSLIDSKSETSMTFGEFVEIICTMCCFETTEMLRYLFYILDVGRTGLVEKNEMKHFIATIWSNEVLSNVKTGLQYLDKIDDGDGTYNFKEIVRMHQIYPLVFFPLFNLQFQMIKTTFGEIWWENHKATLLDHKKRAKEIELSRLKQRQKNEAKALEMANDDLIIKRMGKFRYYMMPWLRSKERDRIAKIAAIESEIDDMMK